MSFTQKDLIIEYRKEGLSFREIAEKVHASENYCRTICSRANIHIDHNKEDKDGFCRYCGKQLVNTLGAKPKQFCSNQCRYDYHNREKMRKAYVLTCKHCGNEFVSFGFPKKLYCCRDCQMAAIKKR